MKHSEQEKKAILDWIQTNHSTCHTASKHFGINHTSIRCWLDPLYNAKQNAKTSERIRLKRKNDPLYRKRYNARINNRRRNEWYSKQDEEYTLNLFEHQCAICGSKEDLCFDHWIPYARGGKLTRTNTTILCKRCNTSKKDKLPHDIYPPEVYQRIEEKLHQEQT